MPLRPSGILSSSAIIIIAFCTRASACGVGRGGLTGLEPPPLLCSALYDCLPRFQAARKAAWFEAIIMHSYSMEMWAGPSNAHADC